MGKVYICSLISMIFKIISEDIPDGSPIETTIGFFSLYLFIEEFYICIFS